MYLFLEVAASGGFPLAFVAVYFIGFIAAVTIGSLAWYNSKRPPGWEDKERPDFLPKVDTKESNSNQE